MDFDLEKVSFRWTFLPALYKRKAFEHERELRAVYMWVFITGEAPLGEYEPVNVDALVESVYVAPGAPRWFRDTVQNLIIRYSLTATVQQSKLDASPFE